MEQTKFEKKFAVITGASSGIGYFLAHEFAENGFDILVVAENAGIETASSAFREHGNLVHSVVADLSIPAEVEKVYHRIQDINCPVDVLVLNAGFGVGGASFDKTDINKETKMVNVNILSTIHLCKRVLPEMLSRRNGKILFTSSVAALMPGPYETVYAATKAFVQSFADGLREEVKDKDIQITTLLPGPTETNFFHRADMDDTKVGQQKKDDPKDVAKQGFEALMSGDDSIVAGSFKTKMQSAVARMLPQTSAAKMHKSMSKPNSLNKR